jgi:PAS domain S-box-containing protein
MNDHESSQRPAREGDEPTRARDDAPGTPSLRARYQAVLGLSPTAILTLDRNGVVLEANKAAVELMPVTAQELIGTPLRSLVGPELHPLIDRALTGMEVHYEGVAFPAPVEGELWLRGKWTPIHDEEGVVLGGVALIHDVTPEKRAADLATMADKAAYYDPVTTLPNRVMLTEALERALAGVGAGHRQLALLRSTSTASKT